MEMAIVDYLLEASINLRRFNLQNRALNMKSDERLRGTLSTAYKTYIVSITFSVELWTTNKKRFVK